MHEDYITVVKVEPGREPYITAIKNTLEAKQAEVGGLIQFIPYEISSGETYALICSDEGKLNGEPYNRCLFDRRTGKPFDIVCGNFIVCNAYPDSDEFNSLTREDAEKIIREFPPEVFLECADGSVAVMKQSDLDRYLQRQPAPAASLDYDFYEDER